MKNNVDIIAEIGINHDGSFQKALLMIKSALDAGAKIVKFQYYDAAKILGKDSPYYEYANSCQFTKEQHERLRDFCDAIGMEYMVSVFDIADVAWADGLVKRHKVASRMNKDKEFIQSLRDTGKEVIISLNSAVSEHELCGEDKVRFMYCITKYPTSEEEQNKDLFLCNEYCGLSSHCPSIQPTLAAVAQGANLVEHHVCFSREEPGCDKPASITFDELRQLCLMVNRLEVV